MKRKRKSAPNHERWLVSYSDFITLLFAFFVVLYSSSQVDKRKVGELALAIQVAFQQMGAFPASTSTPTLDFAEPMPFSNLQILENTTHNTDLGEVVAIPGTAVATRKTEVEDNLDPLRDELTRTLSAEIARNEIALRTGTDGLIISLHEMAFFDSGSAQVRAGSLPTFARIARILNERAYRIRIEGHTDNKPIHTPQFSSNWELSTARATELVRMLIIQYGFSPARLAAAGYAQYHPVATNDTADGRAQNRRVDLVVLGKLHPTTSVLAGAANQAQ